MSTPENRKKSANFLANEWHPAHKEAREVATALFAPRVAAVREALEGERFLLSVMREFGKRSVATDVEKCQGRIETLEGELEQLAKEQSAAITVERRRIMRERKASGQVLPDAC